jgi:hypothetical protein
VIRVDGDDVAFSAPDAMEMDNGLTPGDRVQVTLYRGRQGVCADRIEKVE